MTDLRPTARPAAASRLASVAPELGEAVGSLLPEREVVLGGLLKAPVFGVMPLASSVLHGVKVISEGKRDSSRIYSPVRLDLEDGRLVVNL